MIYQVAVHWERGDDEGRVIAFIQASHIEHACVEAKQVVRKMYGPAAMVNATNAREMNQTVVLVPDGEKPKWLSRTETKDLPGQQKIAGVDKPKGGK